MKQQRQLLKKLATIIHLSQPTELTNQNGGVGESKNGLGSILEEMKHQMNIIQQEHEKYKQELSECKKQNRMYQSSMREMGQQLQRLRLLLPIKDELIVACKKQITALEQTLKYADNSSVKKMKDSTIEFSVSRVFEDVGQSFKEKQNGFSRDAAIGLGQTKSKISIIKREEDCNRKDLQMAKLKNQICKLMAVNRNLSGQINLLRMENEHLITQNEVSKKERQFLSRTIQKMMSKPNDINLHEKCQKLERYIDKLTTKVQKIDIPQESSVWGRRVDMPLHPPTPHFSCAHLGNPHKPRKFDFPQVLEISESTVSMGQSVSQGLQ